MNTTKINVQNLSCEWLFSCLLIALFWLNTASAAPSNEAKKLTDKHQELASQLANNPFKRPLYLNSTESTSSLKGEIYGVINYPFSKVDAALNNPANWCDMLILHVNMKYCRANTSKNNVAITVFLGKKDPQALEDAYKVTFDYKNTATSADYFAVALNAEQGPLGTHDYHISIEATPLKDGQTFLHFTYAYSFGLAGRLGMKGYLATAGKDKIGFTVADKQAGELVYVKGVRGVVERNTMRYYLAIDAYLSALNIAADNQFSARLKHWFDATEQYAPQLHEVERADYLEMKRVEYARQKQEIH